MEAVHKLFPLHVKPRGIRLPIPISVKTRIGYEKVTIRDWINTLAEAQPAAISVHGRTLQQMYRGSADWDAIGLAAEALQGSYTILLGNGDVSGTEDILKKCNSYPINGVLIGRAAMGNPWIFRAAQQLRLAISTDGHPASISFTPSVSIEERLKVMQLHLRLIDEMSSFSLGFRRFLRLVKPYTQGMPEASNLRQEIYKAKNSEEIACIIQNYLDRSASTQPDHLSIKHR